MPTSAAEGFRWGDIDQRLLSPKISDVADEMQKRVVEGEREIAFETRKSGNAAGYLPRLFEFHEKLTEEWVEKLFTAHCEAWTQQNRTVSAAFIRGVRDRAIIPVIATRKATVQAGVSRRGTATGKKPKSAALGAWNRKMDRLAVRWSRKLEAEAVASEYRVASEVDDDRRFGLMAVEEARKSDPEDDKPHPKVGAVVVKNGRVLATAHRGEAKGNHAEFLALEKKLPHDSFAGATVYTTLEPCTKRNPPKIACVERIIVRKISRVVIGMLDPNPEIRGLGQRKLRAANIVTDFFPPDLMAQVEDMNREFTRAYESPTAVPEALPQKATSSQHPVGHVAPSDPRIYVDVLDRRGGLTSGNAFPATVFRFRNEGGGAAHKVQLQPIISSFGDAVFRCVDSIAVGTDHEVVPDIKQFGTFQKHDVAYLLMKQWDVAGELTEEYLVPCSVKFEDYSGKIKFESRFDLVYYPILDISRRRRRARGETRPNDREILQVRNINFKRLSDAAFQPPSKPEESDLPTARPIIVPKRYGDGVLKNDMGYAGLAVVNDGEPAYDLEISSAPIVDGAKLYFHHGHTERLTKNDGEVFYPAFIEMKLGGTFGSGLFDFMRERGIDALTVPITYRDFGNHWFQTDITLMRDVEKSGGLRLGWSQKQIPNPSSAA
jgi:pyrimidine deaminase RibD-like protein